MIKTIGPIFGFYTSARLLWGLNGGVAALTTAMWYFGAGDGDDGAGLTGAIAFLACFIGVGLSAFTQAQFMKPCALLIPNYKKGHFTVLGLAIILFAIILPTLAYISSEVDGSLLNWIAGTYLSFALGSCVMVFPFYCAGLTLLNLGLLIVSPAYKSILGIFMDRMENGSDPQIGIGLLLIGTALNLLLGLRLTTLREDMSGANWARYISQEKLVGQYVPKAGIGRWLADLSLKSMDRMPHFESMSSAALAQRFYWVFTRTPFYVSLSFVLVLGLIFTVFLPLTLGSYPTVEMQRFYYSLLGLYLLCWPGLAISGWILNIKRRQLEYLMVLPHDRDRIIDGFILGAAKNLFVNWICAMFCLSTAYIIFGNMMSFLALELWIWVAFCLCGQVFFLGLILWAGSYFVSLVGQMVFSF